MNEGLGLLAFFIGLAILWNFEDMVQAITHVFWKRIELKHLIAQNEATRLRLIEQGVLKQQEKVSRDTN